MINTEPIHSYNRLREQLSSSHCESLSEHDQEMTLPTSNSSDGDNVVLSVDTLNVAVRGRHNSMLSAISDVSFSLHGGEILGLVGESGAGKSLTGMALMKLIDPPADNRVSDMRLLGTDIGAYSETDMRKVRGREIAMVFQDPLTSLDPMMTVGDQLIETMLIHHPNRRSDVTQRVLALLEEVRMPEPSRQINSYPHELSGGLRQRVVIALALAADPVVIVADEPTTALDVSIQAQILELLKHICVQRRMAILLITHDMGVIAQTTHRVGVMYAGRLVEVGPTATIMSHPAHPYTQGLMAAVPSVKRKRSVFAIRGRMPGLNEIPHGCAFSSRCPLVQDQCFEQRPLLKALTTGTPQNDIRQNDIRQNGTIAKSVHNVACHFADSSINSRANSVANKSGESVAFPVPPVTDNDSDNDSDSDSDHAKTQTVNIPPHTTFSHTTFSHTERVVMQLCGVGRIYRVADRGLSSLLGKKKAGVEAVRGFDLSIIEGKTTALVGESGCGKSTVARMAVGLLEPTSGHILFDGLAMVGSHLNTTRNHRQMIFQDPQSSMNGYWRIHDIIAEPMRALKIDTSTDTSNNPIASGKQSLSMRVSALLERVGLPDNVRLRFPHELSGGQRQRVCIARAIATNPRLIICDEPTSALDVSVQAQIIALLKELQRDLAISYLFISHDLAVVRWMADVVAVMSGGEICEINETESLFSSPQHSYTQKLLKAVPSIN